MRIQDIKVGDYLRHRDHPNYCYAKVLKVLKPIKSKYARQSCWDRTEDEKNIKESCVKVEWTQYKNDMIGFIKYFRPCDLVKDKEAKWNKLEDTIL